MEDTPQKRVKRFLVKKEFEGVYRVDIRDDKVEGALVDIFTWIKQISSNRTEKRNCVIEYRKNQPINSNNEQFNAPIPIKSIEYLFSILESKICRRFVKREAGENTLQLLQDPHSSQPSESSIRLLIGNEDEEEHSDSSVLTVSISNKEGLKIKDKKEGWISPPSRCMFFGNDASIVCGTDLSKPVYHRVDHSNNDSEKRFSIVFFFRADPLLLGHRSDPFVPSPLPQCNNTNNNNNNYNNRNENNIDDTEKKEDEGDVNRINFVEMNEVTVRILVQIFQYLPMRVVVKRCSLVCKVWSKASHSPKLWQYYSQFKQLSPPKGSSYDRSIRASTSAFYQHTLFASYTDFHFQRNSTANIKVVLVGDTCTGKSQFLSTLNGTDFDNCCTYNLDYARMDPSFRSDDDDRIQIKENTGDTAGVPRRISKVNYTSIGLWDTSSDPAYDRLRPLSYPPSDFFLVIFSLISKDSLHHVKEKWVPEIQHHCPSTRYFLVGTFADKREFALNPSVTVSYDEGLLFAQSLPYCVGYVECCGYSPCDLESTFTQVARVVMCREVPNQKKKNCVVQ